MPTSPSRTIPAAMTAPSKPCTKPSTMNGSLMNQLVAPTSRMTLTSRRREKIAIRMALRISTSAEISSTSAMTSSTICRTLLTEVRVRAAREG